MSMTHQRADTTLNAALRGGATPHIWLHIGNPGAYKQDGCHGKEFSKSGRCA